MVEAPSFVHLTDFRTAGSWVPGRFSLASLCHGYASWQPSHPLRPPWSMGRTVWHERQARCVPEERVATHHGRLNQP
jgi:hypothetical protein